MCKSLSHSWNLSLFHYIVGSYHHDIPASWVGQSAILEDRNINIWTQHSVCQGPVLIRSLIGVYSHYSYRKRDIEQLLVLTDSFTWEELPTRDPDSGNLTKAGYIPIIQDLTKYMPVLMTAFNITQCTVRMVISHDMFFGSWYPFDVSVSPMYEIINFTQVILKEQLD
jgi:hypothetical protein